MEYKFFDKGFLVMPDDSHVIGKNVFYADSLQTLIYVIEHCDFSRNHRLHDISIKDYEHPFDMGESKWKLVYYDPNYECKVAFSQGKRIQYRMSDTDKWEDILGTPGWYKGTEYRIKPEKETRRMTNRELAKWLSEGKGEALIDDVCQIWIRYLVNESDLPVKDSVGIRAWGEDLWREPLVEVDE